ncbi:MAG: ribosome maturation factor RimP [Pseudomonadota bacterium]
MTQSEKERVAEQVSAKVSEEILEPQGVELVDVEYRREGGQWVLRLYVDRPGGITLEDCARVSRQVGDLLEVADFMEQAYTLEVSSPGLDRPLKKERDFERYQGHEVNIKTHGPVEGRKHFRGRLMGLREGKVEVEVDGQVLAIPRSAISRANLDIGFELTRSGQ